MVEVSAKAWGSRIYQALRFGNFKHQMIRMMPIKIDKMFLAMAPWRAMDQGSIPVAPLPDRPCSNVANRVSANCDSSALSSSVDARGASLTRPSCQGLAVCRAGMDAASKAELGERSPDFSWFKCELLTPAIIGLRKTCGAASCRCPISTGATCDTSGLPDND